MVEVEKHPGNISARPINQPHAPSICLSLSRVHLCPAQIPDMFWLAKGRNSKSMAADREVVNLTEDLEKE